MRVLYRLRFSGSQTLSIGLAPGQSVSRMFLNGNTIAGETSGSDVTVDVHPSDAGDDGATLELVVTSSRHNYLLKGGQSIRLPTLSWPVNVLDLKASLPAVFNYRWRAGTLAPVESLPDVRYTHEIPTPGKHLYFRRYLVSKARAEVSLDYDVDLKGQYFTVR